MQTAARTADRTDHELGIVEQAAFFGEEAQKLFGVLHLPLGRPPVNAVVICPAICTESLTTYRNDVLLARALASRGIAALRFHYRGTGHSDGQEETMTFEAMREDTLAAVAHAAAQTGTVGPALLGTRFGALVAAAAAAELPETPLVLWEPVLEARRYFREAWRASMMFKVREGVSPEAGGLAGQLEREGVVDVLGYPIWRPLYESSIERTLLEEVGTAARPVLLAHGEGATAVSAAFAEAARTLTERGCAVDVDVFAHPFVWWFVGHSQRGQIQQHVEELVRRTVDWADSRLTRPVVA
jgi:alpha-beta hydrolase superfamily lysophospholipase